MRHYQLSYNIFISVKKQYDKVANKSKTNETALKPMTIIQSVMALTECTRRRHKNPHLYLAPFSASISEKGIKRIW